MIPVVLELGGSDPAIVLEDADLRTAVSGILWGRFSNAGQTCVAPKRVLAVSAIHDRFVAKLAEAVTALGVGPERDLGALIRPWQTAHLEEQLADALARGARIAARAAAPTDVPGYFAPTLLTDVTPEMRVMREESFGPLLPVLRVRDAEEALAIANDTPFGLSASIWSRDTARAVRLAARVEAGTVHINDAVMGVGMADVPHGGVKESGTGRMHGAEGLLECVRSKAVIVDRLPGTPQPWWFESGGPLDAFVRFSHGESWRERLAALPGTLALLMRMRRTR
jgi:acyl-CoA reductase-like NAD-dependent aldehyde dehydrogenase